MRASLRSAVLLLAWAALALSGCGGGVKKVTAHGRLLNNNQPLTAPGPLPPGDAGLRVTFYPTGENEGKEAQQAIVNPDGTFELPGNDRKGVLPGRYRVAISVGAYGMPDKLQGAFGENNSPIYREVTGGPEEMVIDIAKKE
jgi:hypothetical protein